MGNLVKSCRYGMMCFSPLDAWIGRSLLLYGEFSENECVLFKKLIPRHGCVVDVGANIGAHTLAFAKFVGMQGKVYALEPQKFMFYMLCGNVAINSKTWVECICAAAGTENGEIDVPDLNYNTFGNFGGVELNVDHREAKTYKVPMVTIDSLDLPKCDFIKIDVEGMEEVVLGGCVETIKKHKPYIYVEDDREKKSESLKEKIKSLGYDYLAHEPMLYYAVNYDSNLVNHFVFDGGKTNIASRNLLCFPKGKELPEGLEKEYLLRREE